MRNRQVAEMQLQIIALENNNMCFLLQLGLKPEDVITWYVGKCEGLESVCLYKIMQKWVTAHVLNSILNQLL